MKNIRSTITRLWQPAVILLWGVAAFGVFQSFHKYHFYYQEQTQLFLCSWRHALGYLSQPAWAACLAGDWLTQFYYYTYAGPAILTVCLLVLGDVLRRALQKAGARQWLAFVLAIAGMTLVASMCFNERYRLPSVIALMGGAALFWLTPRRLAGKEADPVATLLMGSASFWLFGNGLLVYAALTVLAALLKRSRWVAVGAVLLVLVAVPALRRHYVMDYATLYTYPGWGKPGMPSKAVDRELEAITEYGLGNKNRVAQMVETAERPTDGMMFYYWLIKAEQGQLPDALLRWQWPGKSLGTFYEIASATPTLTTYSLNDLYWLVGDMTHTERAAMLANVFSPQNRNVKMTKRLAEVSLVTGARPAAEKYLRLLQQTWVYGDWATRLLQGDKAALQPYADKARLTNQRDTIQVGQNMHTVLMQLTDSQPDNVAALDYMLCSVLVLKDLQSFKRDYDRYCLDTHRPRPKRLYQEALCICLAATNAPQEEWQRYIQDPSVLSRFAAYNQQRGSTAFSDTYWYYYDQAPKVDINQ